MSKTPAEDRRDQYTITKRECAAMRLLARDGWEIGTLRLCFEVNRYSTIRSHVEGECGHQRHGVAPLRDWDGRTPPSRPPAAERYVTLEE